MGDAETMGFSLDGIVRSLQQLTSAITQLVKVLAAPFTILCSWFLARRQLQSNLGEWSSQAMRDGRWHRPVLGKEALERHLAKTDGRLTPTCPTTSSFAWAKLLYALNIRPNSDVVGWEVVPSSINPMKTGQLSLMIEGPALCHILNLYRLYETPDPQGYDEAKSEMEFELSFGKLRAQKEGDTFLATFEQRNPEALASEKVPFSTSLRGDHLNFLKGELFESYLCALDKGVSENAWVWPKPTASFAERLNALVENLKRLAGGEEEREEGEEEHAFLVCRNWLEDGSRIYRRATSNDQPEPILLRDIANALVTHDSGEDMRRALESDLGPSEDGWKSSIVEHLRKSCLFGGETISLTWSEEPSSDFLDWELSDLMKEALPDVIHQLEQSASEAWARRVRANAANMVYLFRNGPVVYESPGAVLEFTRKSALWKASLEIVEARANVDTEQEA